MRTINRPDRLSCFAMNLSVLKFRDTSNGEACHDGETLMVTDRERKVTLMKRVITVKGQRVEYRRDVTFKEAAELRREFESTAFVPLSE